MSVLHDRFEQGKRPMKPQATDGTETPSRQLQFRKNGFGFNPDNTPNPFNFPALAFSPQPQISRLLNALTNSVQLTPQPPKAFSFQEPQANKTIRIKRQGKKSTSEETHT